MKHLFGRADERVQAERRQRRPERRVVRRNRRLAAEPHRARVARPARQPHDRLAPHGHARRFRIERDRRPADTQRDENQREQQQISLVSYQALLLGSWSSSV